MCLRNSSKGDSFVDGGYFSLDVRNILSLRPRKEANSSSAAGIPPLPQSIAGTLGKVVVFFYFFSLSSVFETNDRRYVRVCVFVFPCSEWVVNDVRLTSLPSSLIFPWMYPIT